MCITAAQKADSEWCQGFQKQVEKVDLLMVIEYLSIIEIFKDLAKGQDDTGF